MNAYNNRTIKIIAMKEAKSVIKELTGESGFASGILGGSLFFATRGMGGRAIGGRSWLLKKLLIFAAGLSFVLAMDSSAVGQSGGVFIPRNGCYEGCMGSSHVFFKRDAGGAMSIVTGQWPEFRMVAKLDMVFVVRTRGTEDPLEVRQSQDKNPQILFLEEGNERIGLRVLFKLYGPDNVYHGHGMTETWLYPNGEMFITAAAMFENAGVDVSVNKAWLDIDIPKGLKAGDLGDEEVGMNDAATPGRRMWLTSAEPGSGASERLSLYWRTGRMEYNSSVSRHSFGQEGAPSYFRWPDYVRQAYAYNFTKPSGTRAYADKVVPSDHGVQLSWPIDPGQPSPSGLFNTFFRLAMVAGPSAAGDLVAAERDLVKMTVTGGMLHGNVPGYKGPIDEGYNDQEGCYEVRKTGSGPMVVTLPADALERSIRVKAVGLTKHGAVTVTLNGRPLVPQLTSDGGIADDPLAPIHEPPEAPADAAMIRVKLTDKPQTLTIREEDGIQLVYQSRDPQRNYAIYSSKTGPRWSGMLFSLVDGHARHMRAYGKENWALAENLLHWFSNCGYTPEQMLDQLRDFVVVKNGPDEIVFKYSSENATGGAKSEFLVSARADAPAMQINVGATFTVLERWPYESSQFFDIFPFRGVQPSDWWYGNILWLTPEGKWKTQSTVKWTFDGDKRCSS